MTDMIGYYKCWKRIFGHFYPFLGEIRPRLKVKALMMYYNGRYYNEKVLRRTAEDMPF